MIFEKNKKVEIVFVDDVCCLMIKYKFGKKYVRMSYDELRRFDEEVRDCVKKMRRDKVRREVG